MMDDEIGSLDFSKLFVCDGSREGMVKTKARVSQSTLDSLFDFLFMSVSIWIKSATQLRITILTTHTRIVPGLPISILIVPLRDTISSFSTLLMKSKIFSPNSSAKFSNTDMMSEMLVGELEIWLLWDWRVVRRGIRTIVPSKDTSVRFMTAANAFIWFIIAGLWAPAGKS
jgi:hypothetical protein